MTQASSATDEMTRVAFREANKVLFMARPHNDIRWRTMFFKGATERGEPILVSKLMPIIGITASMLAPVWGKSADVTSYEELGSFPLGEAPFKALAHILGKTIEVIREESGPDSEYHYLFTVSPLGVITVDAKTTS